MPLLQKRWVSQRNIKTVIWQAWQNLWELLTNMVYKVFKGKFVSIVLFLRQKPPWPRILVFRFKKLCKLGLYILPLSSPCRKVKLFSDEWGFLTSFFPPNLLSVNLVPIQILANNNHLEYTCPLSRELRNFIPIFSFLAYLWRSYMHLDLAFVESRYGYKSIDSVRETWW